MQIIRSLIKLLFISLSCLIPRNKKKWVFGNYSGFADNSKYLFISLSEKAYAHYSFIWIGNSKDEVSYIRSLGLNSYYRWSVVGMYHSLTAGVYIYNSYINDINITTFGGAIKVNLWHGIGIKNIERKITTGPLSKVYNGGYLNKLSHLKVFIKPDVFLSTSPMMTKHFSECFGIGEKQCIESFYPRCDIFRYDDGRIKSFIGKYGFENQSKLIDVISRFSKCYIYMPTWRDTDDDFIRRTGIDFSELNKALSDSNSLLILKLHPMSHLNIDEASCTNIIKADNDMDIYPILPFTHCLITDYSSIYYDYILQKNKDVIFYIPDYREYIGSVRDFAFDFNECTIGEKVFSFEELLSIISSQRTIVSNQDRIMQMFWTHCDDSAEDLFQKIVEKVN